ncbi:helix-turn-helix domain-containing protein [Mucilaginibacter sp. SJ]|uniref:helix-turn-helix domain-containing protein n=1 Tax=Mucilaginibacter sp. SJ TaxID=3029053 RepID=UPI0023AA1258|nr:AraC family transcriptional regulator [Mucilaginibacter sp. SJ]WEA01806.1 AraC family transcriptional regulator [Mucilaginibacter sp. SJ]
MVEAEQRQKGSSRKQKDHGRRVCIIPPGTPVRDAINGLDGLLIHFNDQLFADSSVARTCLNHRRSLKKCSVATFLLSALDSFRVQQIVGAIADELTCNHPERNDMIAIKILELLILCESMNSETADEEETLETHPVIEQFNNLLERNYTRERSVRYYADTLGIHPNHLNYLVKKHTRLNAKESINNRVVQRSKQLLAQSGLIIKEIAYQLGFEDPNNFSTFFQKYAGISPVAFRSASA